MGQNFSTLRNVPQALLLPCSEQISHSFPFFFLFPFLSPPSASPSSFFRRPFPSLTGLCLLVPGFESRSSPFSACSPFLPVRSDRAAAGVFYVFLRSLRSPISLPLPLMTRVRFPVPGSHWAPPLCSRGGKKLRLLPPPLPESPRTPAPLFSLLLFPSLPGVLLAKRRGELGYLAFTQATRVRVPASELLQPCLPRNKAARLTDALFF